MSVLELNRAKKLAQLNPPLIDVTANHNHLVQLKDLLIQISRINRYNPLTWPKYLYLLHKASKLILKDIKK